MKTFLIIAVCSFLSGCAVYRIEAQSNIGIPSGIFEPQVELKKKNSHPQGLQCFEPMLFALTAGVVPIHCVNTYSAALSGAEDTTPSPLGNYKVTTMNGWLPLLLIPFPKWKYGLLKSEEAAVKGLIISNSAKRPNNSLKADGPDGPRP